MILRAILLVALVTSTASAQDVAFPYQEFREPDRVVYERSSRSTLLQSGELSLVYVCGGRVVTPAGGFPGREGRLVLIRQAPDGSTESTLLSLHGREVLGHGKPLPDGGLLVLAQNHEVNSRAQAMVVRFDASGHEVWRRELEHTAAQRCDPSRTLCGFVDLQNVVVGEDDAWISGAFKPGSLELGNARLRGRRGLNGFTARLSLADGTVRWVRSVGGGDDNLSLRRDVLVHWDGHGDRPWAYLLSADTGRPVRRVPLEADDGEWPEQFVAQGDGYAAITMTHIAADQRNEWHLVGWNAAGRRRFRIPVPRGAKLRSLGDSLLLTEPRAPSARDVGAISDGVRNPRARHARQHAAPGALHRLVVPRLAPDPLRGRDARAQRRAGGRPTLPAHIASCLAHRGFSDLGLAPRSLSAGYEDRAGPPFGALTGHPSHGRMRRQPCAPSASNHPSSCPSRTAPPVSTTPPSVPPRRP